MKMTFLGSGSSWVSHKHNYQNNVLLESNGVRILIDAGTTIQPALEDEEIDPRSIHGAIITHCHGDHVFGLEYLGFLRYFKANPFGTEPIKVISTPDIFKEIQDTLSPSMSKTNNGIVPMFELGKCYFIPHSVNLSDSIMFSDLDVKIQFIETIHVKDKQSFGLLITVNNTKIFYTSDTQFHTYDEYLTSDIIFQDCEFAVYPNGVHAQYHELFDLPIGVKSKMWLMHSNIEVTKELQKTVRYDGFRGVVSRGQVFEF